MYVLNYVEDTVWLRATAYNRCAPEGVSNRYWFVCSFYDVDEFGSSAESADFRVMPNPNKGQMTLHFEHLTGKVDVKVYDMTGRMIDQIQMVNNMESAAIPYDLKVRADGIYFFVVNGKEGTITRKVIINR